MYPRATARSLSALEYEITRQRRSTYRVEKSGSTPATTRSTQSMRLLATRFFIRYLSAMIFFATILTTATRLANPSLLNICNFQQAVCSLVSTVWQADCPTLACEIFEIATWSTSSSQTAAKVEPIRRDYALAGNGGSVIAGLTSATAGYFRMNIWDRFKFEVQGYSSRHADVVPPTVVIRSDVRTGECWAFHGSHGHIGLSLHQRVNVTHISIHHPQPEELSLLQLREAPTSITVWALIAPPTNNAELITVPQQSFIMSQKAKGKGLDVGIFAKASTICYDPWLGTRQTFALHKPLASSIVVLEIRNEDVATQTCLYRVSIHGEALS
ncbi:hypothetical protein AAF712_003956 [Marasmius tenuissimus]|uniref:SUN domain-containing protein n=1 Tax=Marasmius tenuissimus TaxID=585030 RepID=A0ABR3A5U4_9AGAR